MILHQALPIFKADFDIERLAFYEKIEYNNLIYFLKCCILIVECSAIYKSSIFVFPFDCPRGRDDINDI